MARKKHEEPENHERWLVSYADFITLLFAFFVVMYSVSSVNEGKYRTVSESIKAALNPVTSPPATKLPFTIGETKPQMIQSNLTDANEPVLRRLRDLIQILHPISPVELSDIHIDEQGHGTIMISLPESILFESGASSVRPEAFPYLKALAEVLLPLNRPIRVLGHTDNVPIRSEQFPSNWELSIGRAAAVVRILAELNNLPASRLSATGFADTKPVASNDTMEGRRKNRRVQIVILEREDPREILALSDLPLP